MNENELDLTARAWLDDGPTRMSDRAVLSTLEEIHTTRQRRSWWPAWGSDRMETYAKLIAGAAAVLLVTVIGYQFLPGNGGIGGRSTPTPSPMLLASGTFTAKGAEVKLDATDGRRVREPGRVDGEMASPSISSAADRRGRQ